MTSMTPALVHPVDRDNPLPIYLQLCERFKTAIAQGHLRPGDRVPAVRGLASELNLARGTVEAAYRVLTEEGYLIVRGPAGTIVSPRLPATVIQAVRAQAPAHAPAYAPTHAQINVFAPPSTASPAQAAGTALHRLGDRAAEQTADTLRSATGTADSTGGTDAFYTRIHLLQMGLPALDAFPRKLWNRLAARQLRSINAAGLAYPNPAGFWPLRERIATYLGLSRGVACLPEQVFVTTGYRAALELTLRTLFTPRDLVWFEDPGYIHARQFLTESGAQLVPVPVDREGLNVAEGIRLAEHARFAVVTPSHQSPLGVTLSLERRMALLQWAAEKKSWIIEDDYDSEYRYRGRPLPALKHLDEHNRVIYCGTFSKVLFPGLRLAYMVVPPDLVDRFQQGSANLNAGCPRLYQATVADFIAGGHFARHLKKMRTLNAQRRDYLAEAMRDVFGERLRIELHAGGLHLLAMLPPGEDDVQLAARANAAGFGV